MSSRLTEILLEIERHVAEGGWDQRPKLYALVETADLVRREPALAAQMGLSEAIVPPGSLTPIEQEELGDGELDVQLAGIAWPPQVLGCVLAHEVLVLPPSAEEQLPAEGDAAAWAAAHPDRREVRLAAAVMRDGTRASAIRLRGEEDDVLTGPDLVPGLSAALAATFED